MDKYVRKRGAGERERDRGEEEKRGKKSIAKQLEDAKEQIKALEMVQKCRTSKSFLQKRQCKATVLFCRLNEFNCSNS
eukprot:1152827-Pelagomonas_calceolata.AAC.3